MRFTTLDWSVLASYLLLVMAVGLGFSRRQTSTAEFFLGGRRFKALAISLSILGTGTSAVSFLGVPGFVIARNWSILPASLMGVPATLLVARLFVPFFYNLKLTSTYDYLDRRFDRKTAALGGILFFCLRVFASGVVLYAPSIALSTVTGWDAGTCVVLSGALTLAYTSLGGISAVIWNDVLQVCVLYISVIILVTELALHLPGGLSHGIREAAAAHKFGVFDFRFSWTSLTFWGAALGGLVYNLAFYGVDQVMVQRYLASKTLQSAQKSLYLNAIYAIPSSWLYFTIGTMLYLYYSHHRDAFPAGLRPDQIFPFYIVRHMPPEMPGIMVAAIYAATMGSLSSVLNSLSTVSVNDFYRRFWRPHEDDHHYLRVGRLLTIGWGLLAIAAGLLAGRINPSVYMQGVKAGSLFLGPLLGMFLLGMLNERISSPAAFLGCLLGLILSFVAGLGSRLELFWLTLLGAVATLLSGGAMALIWPASDSARQEHRPLTFGGIARR